MTEKGVEIPAESKGTRPESAQEAKLKEELTDHKVMKENVSGVLSDIKQDSKLAKQDNDEAFDAGKPLTLSSEEKQPKLPKQDGTVIESSKLKDDKDEKEVNSLEEELKDKVEDTLGDV